MLIRGSIILWRSGGLSHFWVSVCGYIRIYLAVYVPEIIDGFGLEEKSQKTKAVQMLSRKNKLWQFAECATPYSRPSNKKIIGNDNLLTVPLPRNYTEISYVLLYKSYDIYIIIPFGFFIESDNKNRSKKKIQSQVHYVFGKLTNA